MGDHRGADATLVRLGLPIAERCIGNICPAGSEGCICSLRTRKHLLVLRIYHLETRPSHVRAIIFTRRIVLADLVAAAVVGHEENEGVIKLPGLLEGIDKLAYSLVHPVYHGCMDGHCAGIPLGILVVLPSVLELPVGKAVGLVSEEPHLKLALIAVVADGLPAHLVGILVFLDILRKGVEGLFFDELNTWSQGGAIAMVRMGRYKLVYDMLGNGELYDLEKDPSEMRNLYGIRKYAKIRESLLEELLKWEIATEDPIPVPRNRYRFKRFEHNILSHPLPIHIAAGQHGETRCPPRHLLDSPCWPAAISQSVLRAKNPDN